MSREEFLMILWQKAVKPIVLIGAVYGFIGFVSNLFTEDGIGPELIKFALILLLLFTTLYLFKYLVKRFLWTPTRNIASKLPESITFGAKVLGRVLDYLLPLCFGGFLYYMWMKDSSGTIIVFAVIVLERMRAIVEEEKAQRGSVTQRSDGHQG